MGFTIVKATDSKVSTFNAPKTQSLGQVLWSLQKALGNDAWSQVIGTWDQEGNLQVNFLPYGADGLYAKALEMLDSAGLLNPGSARCYRLTDLTKAVATNPLAFGQEEKDSLKALALKALESFTLAGE